MSRAFVSSAHGEMAPEGRLARAHAALSHERFTERGDHPDGTALRALFGVSRESTISALVVRGLLEAVEQSGVPRAELVSAAQLDVEKLDDADGRVSRSKVYTLVELALELSGDPALGLHWAERMNDNAFVPISHLISHAASLRQGFEALANFYRLLSDHTSYDVREGEDEVTVRCLRTASDSPRLQRFCAEMMVAGFFRLLRCFSVNALPERVCFDYAAPSYHPEYSRVFRQLERFDQPFTGIVFKRELLDLPAPHKDADVHRALEALAQRRLLRLTQSTPYALRVREYLVAQGWRQRCDMETVAHALGLSVRSLRRRLAAEGKSYSTVANQALAIVAKHFLRDQQRTIQETAYEMGFSDASSFHRAFKRWTGMTPSSYRASPAIHDES